VRAVALGGNLMVGRAAVAVHARAVRVLVGARGFVAAGPARLATPGSVPTSQTHSTCPMRPSVVLPAAHASQTCEPMLFVAVFIGHTMHSVYRFGSRASSVPYTSNSRKFKIILLSNSCSVMYLPLNTHVKSLNFSNVGWAVTQTALLTNDHHHHRRISYTIFKILESVLAAIISVIDSHSPDVHNCFHVDHYKWLVHLR
jgi:hypothetical protein